MAKRFDGVELYVLEGDRATDLQVGNPSVDVCVGDEYEIWSWTNDMHARPELA